MRVVTEFAHVTAHITTLVDMTDFITWKVANFND